MNYFERELRKIVGCCEYIRNPKYVGRSCIGRLDDGIVVKMEFESTMIRDKYNALRVTLMNRSEGKIDSQLIRLSELWGMKSFNGNDIDPHIWKYNDVKQNMNRLNLFYGVFTVSSKKRKNKHCKNRTKRC